MQPLIQKGRGALVVAKWGDLRPPSLLGALAPSLLLTAWKREEVAVLQQVLPMGTGGGTGFSPFPSGGKMIEAQAACSSPAASLPSPPPTKAPHWPQLGEASRGW